MRYVIVILLLLMPTAAEAVWFDSNWSHRAEIEIVPSQVGTTSAVTNFPVYVNLANMPAGFWSRVQSDGDDIRVVESDEITETPFELVNINVASSTGELHFLADSLSTTSSSTFYIYYGNATANRYLVTDTFGRNNVWSNYRAVYHLSSTTDSTANGHDLSIVGTVTFQNGQVGTDASAGTTAYPNGNALRRASFSMMTKAEYEGSWKTSFWLKRNTANTSWFFMLMLRGSAPQYQTWWFTNSTNNGFLGGGSTGPTSTALTVGEYYKFDVVADGTNLNIYQDGVFVSSAPGYKTTASLYQNVFGFLGLVENTVVEGSPVSMDSVRINIGASQSNQAWITTEFNNQNNPDNFYRIFGEETDEATTTPSLIMQSGAVSGGILIQ